MAGLSRVQLLLVIFSSVLILRLSIEHMTSSLRLFDHSTPGKFNNSETSTMAHHPGFRTVTYFVNWAIYGRNHQPQDLPIESLTHVLYAFANVRPETGEVYLTDTWSDTDKHYPDDSWNDPGGPNLYGCLKQLYLHKQKNRHLKVILSVGGWTYSSNFANPAASEAGRKTFARSCCQLLIDLPFDGIDIDWEYPQNPQQGEDYASLLHEVRHEMNRLAQQQQQQQQNLTTPYHYLLTIACGAGLWNIKNLPIGKMDRSLDFWNLMAYDYAGSWDPNAAHQANMFQSRSNPASTPVNTLDAINAYVQGGVHPHKIVVGCPLYGRAFVGTNGPGTPYSGGIGSGSWENGIWDWKVLPHPGHQVFYDEESMASWSMGPDKDSGQQMMVSWDTAEVAKRKAQFVTEKGFGGIMWWESSGDDDNRTIIRTVGEVLGSRHPSLDKTPNLINYPNSKYENLRNQFSS